MDVTEDGPTPPEPWRPRSWREVDEAGHLESLPETAGQMVPEQRPGPGRQWNGPDDPVAEPGGPPRAAWLVGVLAVLGCLGLALAYFLVIRDQGEVSTVASDGGSPPAETTDATSVTGITIGQSPTSQEQSAAVQSSEAEPSGAGLTGTMVGEQIVVEGEVPTTQASAGLLLLLEQVVGVGNVDIADLAVNPDAATPDRIALVVANEVVFPPSSAEIEGEFLATLDNVADMMTINPDLTAVVEGHADSVGARSVNLSLSQRRADAVVDYLVGNGVERVRLIGMGRGSDEPIADNSTPEGREQNRRIEFIIVGFRLNL